METLIAEGIGKTYKGRQVVRGVNLKISRGEVVGLLGPNGAGKTTSFYMIVGLVQPETGRILVDDKDITRLPMYLRARNYGISYLPQEPSVFRKARFNRDEACGTKTGSVSHQRENSAFCASVSH